MTELNQKDHDLLITLNVKVDGLVLAVKDLKDGLTTRIGVLETDADEFRIWKDRLKIVSWLLAPIYIAVIGLIADRIFRMF